jgi:hypothetical protein
MRRQDAYEFLLWRSRVEEYHGRFRKARELVQQASKMAPSAADVLGDECVTALWEAESGDTTRAKQIVATVLRTVSSRDEKLNLALALARAGSNEQARKMADALDKDSPLDTLVQNYHLPTIRAAIKLNENDPAGAIAALQPSFEIRIVLELFLQRPLSGIHPRPGLPAIRRRTFGSSGVSEITGSQRSGGSRRDWGAGTFADGQGSER